MIRRLAQHLVDTGFCAILRRPFQQARCFWSATAAVSAVEFALVLPLMLLMLLGGYEFSRISAISRKVTLTTRAIADLTTQNVSLTQSSLSTIIAAAAQIFAPYSTANMTIVVTQLNVSALGIATVAWSQASSGAGLPQGTVEIVPAAIAQPNISLIWCTVTYNYVPAVSVTYGPTKVLSDQIYMSPRLSSSISLS